MKFLAGAVGIAMVAFLLYTLLVSVGRRCPRLRPLFTPRSKKILRFVLILITAVIFVATRALALSQPQGHAHDYSLIDSAPQGDPESLFIKEPDREALNKLEVYRKLHIEEGYLDETRFAGMLQHYEALFQSVFSSSGSSDPPDWKPLEYSDYPLIRTSYLEEAQDWEEKYQDTHWPDRLYQCGRALNDAAIELSGISFFLLLDVAADAVSSEEHFLAYGRRNVGSQEHPVWIGPENVALMNGKLLLHLAEYADAHPEGGSYLNCLLAQAYQWFHCGRSQIDAKNPLYAKLTYYLGNIGERILTRMSPDDEPILYQRLGKDTLAYYECCIQLLEQYPSLYEREPNMLKNAKAGKVTLNGLGFQ